MKLKEMSQQTHHTKNGIAVTAKIPNDGLHLEKLNGIRRLNFFEK